MNRFRIAALIKSEANPFRIWASSFHSTHILEGRRRTYWDFAGSGSSRSTKRAKHSYKREKRRNAKKELLYNIGAFADRIFQSWQRDGDEYDAFEDRGSSWFQEEFQRDRYSGRNSRKKGRQSRSRSFHFFVDDEDDLEAETIFRSAFGRDKYSFYSFINDEEPQWRGSYRHSNNHRFQWSWGHRHEEETESDSSETGLASDRLALGLKSSGPLSLDEVKNAYRACALKWHPDRHHGSSKVAAEEKFKLCSAAYQSLCDKLTLN